MLNFCVREIAGRIAQYALAFDGWAGGGPAEPETMRAPGQPGPVASDIPPLPARRRQH
jgi:hypothetical protein